MILLIVVNKQHMDCYKVGIMFVFIIVLCLNIADYKLMYNLFKQSITLQNFQKKPLGAKFRLNS